MSLATETPMAVTNPPAAAVEGLCPAELAAWRGLLRVHASVLKALDAEMEAAHGLPLTSYEVLIQLADAPEHRMRMCDLADSVLLSRSGMSRLVDRLERDGLLVRCACTHDARGAFACITAGRAGAARAGAPDARRRHPPPLPRAVQRGRAEAARARTGTAWSRSRRARLDAPGCAPRLAAVLTLAAPRAVGRPRSLRTAGPATPRRRELARADRGPAPGARRGAHARVRAAATKGVVKGIEPREVAALGYDMVLGNTFHLFLAPGHELVAEQGGLHEFMRWSGPIITDSGGFQVFSMGHGTVADEIKGRAPSRRGPGRRDPVDRGGGRALPLLHRRRRALHGAGDLDGGAGGARLRHRARVRRVHAVPRRPRLHRALDRAHAPLARALPRRGRTSTAAATRPSTRSRRAASTRTCGAARRASSRRAARPASRSAARSAPRRRRCTRSWTGRPTSWSRSRPTSRATCSGSARSTTSCAASSWGSTRSTARCRRGSAATGWRSCRTPRSAGAST